MVDIAHLRTVASDLIAKNGRTVTLVHRAVTDSDPTQPWRGPVVGSESSVSVLAANVDLSDDDMKSDLLRTMTKKFLVAALDLETAASAAGDMSLGDARNFDIIVDEGARIEISQIVVEKPGDTAVLYSLYAQG